MGKTPDFLDVTREYESGMAAQFVQDSRVKGIGLWRLWNTAEEEPYNFVQYYVYKDAAGLFAPLTSVRQETFNKAHPGKARDYQRYVREFSASWNSSKRAVYRVEAAFWK